MIRIIAVGKCRQKELQACIHEYCKRLTVYTKIEIVEVEELAAPISNSVAQNETVKVQEGKHLFSRIRENEYVILLDLHGKSLTSEGLATKMSEIMTYRTSDLCFVIGGSLGLSQEMVARADLRWKLSDLTFPHQLIRLFLVEQIYRAYKIMRNEPYHK